MATVADILAKKGSLVHCISPTATVLEATQLMARHRIGALVVTLQDDDGAGRTYDRVVGMFTERDVLTRIVGEQRVAGKTLVDEVMSTNVAYCSLDTSLEDVSAVMRERRIRHLPVCDQDGRLQGMVSIGDLNAWHADGQAITIHYLHQYIHGRV